MRDSRRKVIWGAMVVALALSLSAESAVVPGPVMMSVAVMAQASVDPGETERANAERVAELVTGLRAPVAAARDAAERKLIESGPEILVLLPDPTSIAHAGQRMRLERIRDTLESQRENRTGNSGTVTLAGSLPLSEALRQIREQSDSEILDDVLAEDDPVCEIRMTSVPFWTAVEKIAAESGRRIYAHPERSAVELRLPDRRSDEIPVPSSTGRLMRTTLRQIRIQRSFDGPETTEMKLRFELFREPALSLLRIRFDREKLVAEIETTKNRGTSENRETTGDGTNVAESTGTMSLNPLSRAPIHLSVAGERITTPVEVSFPAPPRNTSVLTRIRGAYTVAYCGDPVTLTLSDILTHSPTELTAKWGQNLRIRRIGLRRPDDAHLVVILEITWSGPQTFPDSYEIQGVPMEWSLSDPTGTPLTPVTVQTTQSAPESLRVELVFAIPLENPPEDVTDSDPVSPPRTLTITVPRSFGLEQIPFSFENIPLP
ncbi:MAG: hypothetical protein Q4C47_02015 [Planctomycetia bacterium]|nr:hypothetical protein [Planctomycetia bacterium]